MQFGTIMPQRSPSGNALKPFLENGQEQAKFWHFWMESGQLMDDPFKMFSFS